MCSAARGAVEPWREATGLLRAFLVDHLGKHEMPHALELRAELPNTAVGKPSKKELYTETTRVTEVIAKRTGLSAHCAANHRRQP